MRKPSKQNLSVRKTAYYSVITNAIQTVLVLGIGLFAIFSDAFSLNQTIFRAAIGLCAVIVATGAVLDIREALLTRRLLDRVDAMADTIANMESLNNTLRAQRHDFLNHLQVVYSLIEMKDYEEAGRYIDKVYGSITAVSKVMRTANAPINALLQVKTAACEKAGIRVELNIRSAWKDLPMPGWEMCKVLSNLIDNAMDAVAGTPDPHLCITLTEDLHTLRFRIANNGPLIPEELRASIFEPGITTKSDGHGMGLYIVRSTLREWKGDIILSEEQGETVFEGYVPRTVTGGDVAS